MPGLDFNHAMLYTRDVAAALAFYADALGFEVVEVFEGRGRAVYARLKAPNGSGTIALHVAEADKPVPPSEGVRLYFETPDLNAFCERLAASGITIRQPPKLMPWGWMHAYLDDPDGHEISLYWAGEKRFEKSVIAERA